MKHKIFINIRLISYWSSVPVQLAVPKHFVDRNAIFKTGTTPATPGRKATQTNNRKSKKKKKYT